MRKNCQICESKHKLSLVKIVNTQYTLCDKCQQSVPSDIKIKMHTVNDGDATTIEQWKELFFLLKSDFELLENFQTGEWIKKAKEMGIDVSDYE